MVGYEHYLVNLELETFWHVEESSQTGQERQTPGHRSLGVGRYVFCSSKLEF
jgi:hypothetical protein